MANNGTTTIRLNETRDITATVRTPLSNVVTGASGTVKITDADTGTTILDTAACTGTTIILPSSAKTFYSTNPIGLGMTVDKSYNYLFTFTIVVGGRTFHPEAFVLVNVIGDTE